MSGNSTIDWQYIYIYRNIYDIYVCAIIGNYLIQRAKRRDRREIGALRIDGKYSKYN